MRTDVPKSLHRVCGRALLEYALEAGLEAGLAAVAVAGPADDPGIAAAVAGRAPVAPAAEHVAESIRAALDHLPESEHVLLIPADLPQLRADHLDAFLECHRAAVADATVLVVGGVSTGVYAARRPAALALQPEAPAEALFPDANTCSVAGSPLIDVDTRADQARAEQALRREVVARMMEEGVTFIAPETAFIDAGVRIGRDTVVYPWTVIEGKTEIGRRCTIGPSARLVGCTIADDVTVEASVLRESRVAAHVRIGPFAHLRPGADIGEGTKIGDFVEVKNSHVGQGVSIAHLAYVGDADVGDRANIGAGVITCNFDGVRKNRTVIGDDAFVGSNSVLIAPVTVGPGAYVAAHSSINQEVPADALGIARSRQENKPEWARRRRESQKKE